MREIVMKVDGYFLIVAGLGLMMMGLASYHGGKGPLGDAFKERLRPAILNWIEAFGLAAIIGVIFVYVSRDAYPLFWNFAAGGAHLFMGMVNVVLWRTTFVTLGITKQGIVATLAHFVFVALQAYAGYLAL